MLMFTRLIRVETYHKEFAPINLHNHSMRGGPARLRDKSNTLYLHLQKTNGHKTRPGADLQWEAPILKATWPLHQVTNVKSGDNLKNLQFHYHKTYGQ